MPGKPSSRTAVTWFEALNEQTTWTKSSDFVQWLSDVIAVPVNPHSASIDSFNETLRRMRLELSNLHFGKTFDEKWINKELSQCRPGLFASSASGTSRLPAFRVGSQSKNADEITEALRLTLLMQFASFAGDTLNSSDAAVKIERCCGLYREDESLPAVAAFPHPIEKQWRREIEALQVHAENADDITRCADFFIKTPKARFCSDACRFSTFQIVKQLQEPDYLAQKQKRYRDRTR